MADKPRPLFSPEESPKTPPVKIVHFEEDDVACDECGKPRLARSRDKQCDCRDDKCRGHAASCDIRVEHESTGCTCGFSKPAIKPLFAPAEVVPTVPVKAGPVVLQMPGMRVRKRFDVSVEDLRTQNPGVPDPALLSSLQTLLTLDLDDGRFDASGVGVESQQRFAATSDKLLSLATSKQLDEVNQGLREMGSLLSAAELDKLMTRDHSTWNRLFGHAPSFDEIKSSMIEKIGLVRDRNVRLQREIDQLSVMVVGADVVFQELAEATSAVDSSVATARYLSTRLVGDPRAESLSRRLDSLLMTRITIKQAELQAQAIKKHLTHLTETVRVATINMVPAWCGNCSNFLSQLKPDAPDKSALQSLISLRDGIMRILGD